MSEFKPYDQFEARSVGTTSKQIYDFSNSSVNFATGTTTQSSWNIKGKTFQSTNMTTFAGDTGVRNIVFGDPETLNLYGPSYVGSTVAGGLSNHAPLTSSFALIPDNGGEKPVPIITNDVYVDILATSIEGPYRSGAIEFSFKTNQQNTIIARAFGFSSTNPGYEQVTSSSYMADEFGGSTTEFTISIKNGKLNIEYIDRFGNNATSFEISGNKNVSDDQWHHAVINITRPGLERNDGTLSDERSIEFWIDSNLDKKDTEYINQYQIFFPQITRLFGNFEFTGLFRTFSLTTNYPLTQSEIEERFSLWNYQENNSRKRIQMTASAVMVEPQISVNKKRVLKLFWNDIENKNGIELDNNYLVNSYSVTHKNRNSSTETYNVDLAKNKTFSLLTNVRVALTENVAIWGPGLLAPEVTNQFNPNTITLQTAPFTGSVLNLTYSGVELISGDRILLTKQINNSENGVWIFNGKSNPLTRPSDANSVQKIKDRIVYVTEGYQTDTYWILESAPESFTKPQNWTKLNNKPLGAIYSQPFLTSRWSDSSGNNRFINLENDVNISQYDLIVFMNYPETFDEIKNNFGNDSQTKAKYDNFINSLRNVVAQGASLYVSSPLLAADLGIIKDYTFVDQKLESIDAQSAASNPFEFNETSDQYFDTHRINLYHLATEVTGLTNKATYVLTDFINYVPTDINKQEQYHAKYAYKPLGIKAGNEFYIPSLALRKTTENTNLPGQNVNSRGTKPLVTVKAEDILTGTTVTKLQNTYYNGTSVLNNPDDDNVTTLIVHNNQLIKGQPVLGKMFVNFVEDGYTMSRQEYNKAVIQVLPGTDVNETTSTRAWQYSTSRLNRVPGQINIKELTEHGQTTPTNGGGGPIIQAPSNASNGIIRSETDLGNIDYQSDLYTSEAEEIYPIQEIPVLSMTLLGLQWLAE
jgi:hypothetical protein